MRANVLEVMGVFTCLCVIDKRTGKCAKKSVNGMKGTSYRKK